MEEKDKKEQVSNTEESMNITIVDKTTGKHTIDKLPQGLRGLGHSVKRVDKFENSGDIVWVEHLTEAAEPSQNISGRPLVLRLSAMEVYKQKLSGINWKNVDALVVHGIHLKEYFLERFNFLPKEKIHVIPLCIDTEQFTLRKASTGTKFAIVSEVHWRKGTQNIPTILQALPLDAHIYHVGKIVNWDCKNYLEWDLGRRGLSNRYHYEGEIPHTQMNEWLEDKTFILHTSYTEGMPRAVGEAMAKGMKPVVFDYRGAYAQWGEFVWNHLKEMNALSRDFYRKESYRERVVKKYSIPVVAKKVETLCKSLMETK